MDLTVKLDDVEKALDEAAMQIAVATGASLEAARAALIAVSVVLLRRRAPGAGGGGR